MLVRAAIDVEIGSAQRPAKGETVCGDAFAIAEHDAMLFVAVADGLGHGPDAAEPAQRFCACVEAGLPAEPLELIRAATHRLKDTRGAVGAVLRINRLTCRLAFSGVGNIGVRARSAEAIHPVCAPGIIGRRVPRISSFSYPVGAGDVVVIYTDGLSGRFDDELLLRGDPGRVAASLLLEHGHAHDDVTCVVLRVTTPGSV